MRTCAEDYYLIKFIDILLRVFISTEKIWTEMRFRILLSWFCGLKIEKFQLEMTEKCYSLLSFSTWKELALKIPISKLKVVRIFLVVGWFLDSFFLFQNSVLWEFFLELAVFAPWIFPVSKLSADKIHLGDETSVPHYNLSFLTWFSKLPT